MGAGVASTWAGVLPGLVAAEEVSSLFLQAASSTVRESSVAITSEDVSFHSSFSGFRIGLVVISYCIRFGGVCKGRRGDFTKTVFPIKCKLVKVRAVQPCCVMDEEHHIRLVFIQQLLRQGRLCTIRIRHFTF